MMCGVNKEYMVQYSFILGIPAIIAANISQTKDAIEIHQSIEVLPTVIGIITAMVVGVLCIKLLQWILKKICLNISILLHSNRYIYACVPDIQNSLLMILMELN